MSGRTRALLVDLDNTVYDWVGFFARSFKAMTSALAAAMPAEIDALIDEFRCVYRARGSVEYVFAVQELPRCRALPPAQITELVRVAHETFSAERQAHLRVYPGVRETLTELRAEGVRVVAVSNAPARQARRRLDRLGLTAYFDGLAAWDGPAAHYDGPRIQPLGGDEHGQAERSLKLPTWTFPSAELKPRAAMFRHVLEHLRVDPADAFAIGDSLGKDVLPAVALGAAGAWARYGTQLDPSALELLLRITPWTGEEVAATYAENLSHRVVSVDSFDELVNLLA